MRKLLGILAICALGALGFSYLAVCREELEVLAFANPNAACLKTRLLFRVLAVCGFGGLLGTSVFLIRSGLRPTRRLWMIFGVFILLAAFGFVALAYSVDDMLICETLPQTPISHFQEWSPN